MTDAAKYKVFSPAGLLGYLDDPYEDTADHTTDVGSVTVFDAAQKLPSGLADALVAAASERGANPGVPSSPWTLDEMIGEDAVAAAADEWAIREAFDPREVEVSRANWAYRDADGIHVTDVHLVDDDESIVGSCWLLTDYRWDGGKWVETNGSAKGAYPGWYVEHCASAEDLPAHNVVPSDAALFPYAGFDAVLDDPDGKGAERLVQPPDERMLAAAGTFDAGLKNGIWGSCRWHIDEEGILNIGPGTGADTKKRHMNSPWIGYAGDIKNIIVGVGGTVELPPCCEHLFSGLPAKTVVFADADASKVADASFMFHTCRKLETVVFNDFSAPNCKNTAYMFGDCKSLATADLGNITMGRRSKTTVGTFENCESLQHADLTFLHLDEDEDRHWQLRDLGVRGDLENGIIDRNRPGYPLPGMFKAVQCDSFDRYAERYVYDLGRDRHGDSRGFLELAKEHDGSWVWHDQNYKFDFSPTAEGAWERMLRANQGVFGGYETPEGRVSFADGEGWIERMGALPSVEEVREREVARRVGVGEPSLKRSYDR